ncbi:MAG TPA: PQQ-binding-like beta-propeller repeat protein, partial [Chthonomonadales bacterium]|nr:PQQ-binding-like beta-propeller repeat protein [Chthonomonadales bacterium]
GWAMTHSSLAPMTLGGEPTVVYCGSGGVAGISLRDGRILWETEQWFIRTAMVPTPVVLPGNRIFLSGGYNAGSLMLQLERQGGNWVPRELFRLPPRVFGSDQQTPIFYEGYIYGVRPGGELVCIDLNGNERWSSGTTRRFGIGPYVIADGLIFVVSDNGTLTMVEARPDAYRELATARVLAGPDAWGPIAVAGGRIIVRDMHRMVCLDLRER